MDEHPAGYTHLFWKHRIDPDLLRHQWFIRDDSRPKAERSEGGTLVTTLPSGYHPGELDFDHLVFALKYEGVNLSALSRIFEHLHPEELASCIEAMPTSKYGQPRPPVPEEATAVRPRRRCNDRTPRDHRSPRDEPRSRPGRPMRSAGAARARSEPPRAPRHPAVATSRARPVG